MAHPVVLPRQGQSVESCIITQWHKKEGDAVRVGDVLFSYETDKASFDETAKAEGTLLAVFFQADEDVPVLTTVAAIGAPGEDVSALRPDGAAAPAQQESAPAAQDTAPAVQEAAPVKAEPAPAKTESAQAAGVSPRARMTAERLGVDPRAAAPSGPYGRVIERDVFAARDAALLERSVPAPAQPAAQQPSQPAPAAPAAPAQAAAAPQDAQAFTDTKLTNIRKVIARAMKESLSSMAQLTHHSSFDATRLLAMRARFKASPAELGLSGITINDLILFAVSRTLGRHPALNAHFLEDRIREFRHVHLGIAVDTPRGLMVPTLFDADTKSLSRISREARELAQAAVGGNISPDLLAGGTFTVSNLGALGVESFTPIINPPQAAILGVCNIIERVRTAGGQLAAYPAMGLSLTYDHRAVDGAPASRFLKDLCEALEQVDILTAL
ncbi:MAG TPA: dihydrolipoamide acetyltransferase family protein [Candidatus Limnocylindria bacterium]|nr:dihydrolipoamide acetyltransferase family protein [Candidatus Limnocylindria bacterium]